MAIEVENEFEYDVCLSFAGENRSYVEQVAETMRGLGIRVFYDLYEQVNLWGKDLYVHLDEIYRTKAQYCVMFISKEYAAKLWTSHERRSAQARAFKENKEYILPVRFDDTEIPGLPPTVGYLSLSEFTPTQLADMIKAKLTKSSSRQVAKPVQNAVASVTSLPTPESAAVKLKALLVDPQHRIELYDFVTNETEALLLELSQDLFPIVGDTSFQEMKKRIEEYEEKLVPFLNLLIIGCRWGNEADASHWIEALERVSNSNKKVNGAYTAALLELSDYPVLFLMYGTGMASIVGQQYTTLARILTDPIHRDIFGRKYESLASTVYSGSVLHPTIANEILGTQRLYVPVSERLHEKLREPFRELVRDDTRYDELFDRFEFFLAMVHADVDDRSYTEQNGKPKSNGNRFWGPIGRFGYRQRYEEESMVLRVSKEATRQGDQWPPLQAGMFEGSLQRFLEIGTGITELLSKSNWM